MSIKKVKNGDALTMSEDILKRNISKLKELFPELVTEDKIDFDSFKAVFGDEVEEEEEYYRFTWAGKSQARREAHKPSTGTLRPVKEESLDWDTTENMYIEGDNLEVLKLLQKSYAGKIKMIYIDPPYNTGKDFVYKDNYKDNLKNYQEVTGQVDSEGNKTSTNSDADGRYHSNWLNMMYPRLLLARNLLKEDGVIFISIDDHEVENLVKLGNEIFGEENFIDIFSWIKSETPANLSFKTKKCVEYVVSFQKVKDNQKFIGLKRDSSSSNGLMNKTNPINKLVFPVNLVDTGLVDGIYKKGEYGTYSYQILLHENTTVKNGLFIEPVILSGNFKWTQVKLNNEIERGTKISIRTNSFSPAYEKLEYEPEVPWNLISRKFNVDTNENEGKRLKLLFDNHKVFDYPKPITLLNYIFNFSLKNDEILLDFFSGSSSSAHSILDLNYKNNSRLKFIQVQLPEKTEEKSEAFKSGYKTIAEIGKERIRRVVKKIKEEHPEKSKDMDLGFKVFKLDSSNIKSWDGNPENLETSLFDAVENIKTDRTEEDVLYEILLKYGLDLTLPIEERIIEGKKVFNVGLGSLFICLADDITAKVAEGIGLWKEACSPEVCRVVFKDTGFTDVEKTNSVQTLKRYGIKEIRSI